jgi:solute carrier family 25 protein 34/35
MNATRLGTFQHLSNSGLLVDEDGRMIFSRIVLAGTIAGALGGVIASPFYLVKTHLQAEASCSETAVGFQHHHKGTLEALSKIYRQHGLPGLWRGTSGAVPRLMVGSAAQLSTFQLAKEQLASSQAAPLQAHAALRPILASLLSSVVVVLCMTPFDVVSTRLYNQPIDPSGRGTHHMGAA